MTACTVDRHAGYEWSEKGEAQTVLFAINQGWSYELVPCTDEAILALDDEINQL